MAEAKDTQKLRETMNESSMLSRFDRWGAKATEIVYKSLAHELEPGETVLAYADRELPQRQPTDGLSYERSRFETQTDAMEYAHEVGKPEADVMAYDIEAGRAQMDALGYEKGGSLNQTDAFAYAHAEQSPDTNAFISDVASPQAIDVDLLLLTDRRLIRGVLRDGRLEVRKVPCAEGGVCINKDVESVWLEINLPPQLRDDDEDQTWCWEVPQGGNADSSAERWGGGR
jgi:hypothetical protein